MKRKFVLYNKKINAYYRLCMWHTKNEYRYTIVRDLREAKRFTKKEVEKTLNLIFKKEEFEIVEVDNEGGNNEKRRNRSCN